jgi:hypothetical protein
MSPSAKPSCLTYELSSAAEPRWPSTRQLLGKMWFTRWAAVSAIRPAVQEGQIPRRLPEKATGSSSLHVWQRTRAKP